ncbi:hypothetical protein M378DRAFT_162990 [Amanita muscaria Koide BX008]|uniref:Uncharacterized protein n=1 Tax=Amanita muscaria (strain Koide BX008) TaxID=946122 RepID=A0A0C2WSA8_AMAMK|nr:hypothetical protein M378DRAFT_162990 [Amanita muscaria Koide BX008]
MGIPLLLTLNILEVATAISLLTCCSATTILASGSDLFDATSRSESVVSHLLNRC